MININDLKWMLQQMADIDVSSLPSPRFKGFLRQELLQEHAFPQAAAESIAARMVVELGTEPMLDYDLKDMAKSYAHLIEKMRSAFHQQGFTDPVQAVVESAGLLTLKLS